MQSEVLYGAAKKNQMDEKAPLLKGAENRTYEHEGWRIRIAFVRGFAVREVYQKTAGGPVKDFELAAILEAEGKRGKWTQTPKSEIWVRGDGAVAICRLGLNSSVRLETPAAAEADAAAKQLQGQREKNTVPKF